jgi:hypothetical protein
LERARDVNLNQPEQLSIPIAGGGSTTYLRFGPRPITDFGRITQITSDANSNYNALAVQLAKRFSHNFQFLFSYTLSHAIDDKPDSTAVVVGSDDSKLIQNPLRPDLDRGPSDTDVRSRAVISGVYDLNLAKNFNSNSKVVKQIFDGYSLSGIFTATSGRPFNATVSSDLNGDGNFSTDRVPFVGRNTLRGPNFYQLDMRLSKTFLPTEKTKLTFIGEAFNLTNRTNIGRINTNQFFVITDNGVPSLLVPNSAFKAPISSVPGDAGKGANRQFQLALEFNF